MDGIEDLKGVFVLAATNRIDLIDPALLRSGRFDLVFELPFPDQPTREQIFRIHTRNKPLGKDVNLKRLALKTDTLTGSDIGFICRKAATLAIRELIGKDSNKTGEITDEISIRQIHFEKATELVLKQNEIKK